MKAIKIMKKLLLLGMILALTTSISAQQLTESKKGYTEVVSTELKQDAIYQKLKEWISLNYKSAKDVIQLDSKEKLITKGNTTLNYLASKVVVKYRLSFTTVFSIKDNKYKIDLTPTDIESIDYPQFDIPLGVYEMLMTNEILSLEDYLIVAREQAMNTFRSMGYSEKKSSKMVEKTNKYMIESYASYKLNKVMFHKEINSTYTSIKNAVNNKDDW